MGADVPADVTPVGPGPGGAGRLLRSAGIASLLEAVAEALERHRDEIDALNVFPVPDGDTGSNLAATAAATAMAARAGANDPGGAAVRAALRAARGNSGVIFSQVVAALVEVIEESDDNPMSTDVVVLAEGLERADGYARTAVADPVEGTILTALRCASGAAAQAARRPQASLQAALVDVLDATQQAVAATEQQLPMLREAGVVDAGARGLAVVLAALVGAVADTRPPALDAIVSTPRCVPGDAALEAPWEVQYVVTLVNQEPGRTAASALRSSLSALGVSVVVVAGDDFLSAHVHTTDTEAAIAAGRDLGALDNLQVNDLRPPADPLGAAAVGVAAGTAAARGGAQAGRVASVTVAIVPAGGLEDLASASGATAVAGAAGDLPSAGTIADAITTVPADRVVVLPGHPNAVPACRQAALLAQGEHASEVVVLEEVDHPMRVLSTLSLGEAASLDERRAVARACRVGDVVQAVRDGAVGALEVSQGQWVAMADGHGIAAAADAMDVLAQLIIHLGGARAELVTIAAGAGVPQDEMVEVAVLTARVAPLAEQDLLAAGQRPARYLVAVE